MTTTANTTHTADPSFAVGTIVRHLDFGLVGVVVSAPELRYNGYVVSVKWNNGSRKYNMSTQLVSGSQISIAVV